MSRCIGRHSWRNDISVDYSNLAPGQPISSQTYVLDADAVSRYRDAVDDQSTLHSTKDGRALAPSMAVAALSLRGVVNDLAIPGGTLHVGQEVEIRGAVTVGETLECTATVLQNSVRRDWRFMVVQSVVEDSKGQVVMEGKSTIMLPA